MNPFKTLFATFEIKDESGNTVQAKGKNGELLFVQNESGVRAKDAKGQDIPLPATGHNRWATATGFLSIMAIGIATAMFAPAAVVSIAGFSVYGVAPFAFLSGLTSSLGIGAIIGGVANAAVLISLAAISVTVNAFKAIGGLFSSKSDKKTEEAQISTQVPADAITDTKKDLATSDDNDNEALQTEHKELQKKYRDLEITHKKSTDLHNSLCAAKINSDITTEELAKRLEFTLTDKAGLNQQLLGLQQEQQKLFNDFNRQKAVMHDIVMENDALKNEITHLKNNNIVPFERKLTEYQQQHQQQQHQLQLQQQQQPLSQQERDDLMRRYQEQQQRQHQQIEVPNISNNRNATFSQPQQQQQPQQQPQEIQRQLV